MTRDLRWVLVLFSNLLLILLTAEANHYLSFFSLSFFPVGLLLTFGILRLRLQQGLLVNGITGLVLDAMNPLPFGQTFLTIVIFHVLVFSMRGHFARENLRSGTLVANGTNLALFSVFTLLAFRMNDVEGSFWSRALVDVAFSTLVLFLIAPWFLSLQKSILAFIGIDLDAEQREAQ